MGDAIVRMEYVALSFPFFVAQAVAITIEDTMISLARRMASLQLCYVSLDIPGFSSGLITPCLGSWTGKFLQDYDCQMLYPSRQSTTLSGC
jgi:hypothetical protein